MFADVNIESGAKLHHFHILKPKHADLTFNGQNFKPALFKKNIGPWPE